MIIWTCEGLLPAALEGGYILSLSPVLQHSVVACSSCYHCLLEAGTLFAVTLADVGLALLSSVYARLTTCMQVGCIAASATWLKAVKPCQGSHHLWLARKDLILRACRRLKASLSCGW